MTSLDYRILGPDGTIDPVLWAQRHLTGAPVGRCGCGGALIVAGDSPWEQNFDVRWYTAVCSLCTAELAAPNGRVVRQHARAS